MPRTESGMALFRNVLKEGARTVSFEGIKPVVALIAAPVLGLIAFVAGVLQSLPLAYVMAAAAVVFAGIATGRLRFSEWIPAEPIGK
jgi:hypothetical protein